jgi:phenylacetate-CoA ligase
VTLVSDVLSSIRYPGLIELMLVNPRRSPEVIRRIADRRLRQIVQFAYTHVPFYREHWRAGGFHPRDFHTAQDLPAIPTVDKELLVSAGNAVRATGIPESEWRHFRTSGTSGRAIEIVRSRRELSVTRRSILRQLVRIGMRPWHRVLTLGSMWLKQRKGLFVQKVVKTRFLDALMPVDEQLRELHTFQPAALMGQTGGIYLLAREALRQGKPYSLGWVVPTGATLAPHMRDTIREAFSTDPHDMYGALEVGSIGWQCGRHEYHVDADRNLVEIADPQGKPVPIGQAGQVIVTNFQQFGMPFIRYRLRDIGALATRQCGCGVRFPVMEQVRGRVNDFLPTPAGDLVSPHFFFHVFDAVEHNPVKEWRVVQEGADSLIFEYVPETDFSQDALEHGVQMIQQRFGQTCQVQSRAVDGIPLTPAGKQRCIVSKLRPQDADWHDAWAQPVTNG